MPPPLGGLLLSRVKREGLLFLYIRRRRGWEDRYRIPGAVHSLGYCRREDDMYRLVFHSELGDDGLIERRGLPPKSLELGRDFEKMAFTPLIQHFIS